ncbi:hypothetical protein TrCOL_g3351 [Triparma columacea]|uniref:Uncharacterized protein n=1 Tax=Triparma columacea TaxID=722753 RepID=A0A9W7GJN3_9STRA|nr:hypothetical protein TrCOL_g3351 [Triparma columacea]
MPTASRSRSRTPAKRSSSRGKSLTPKKSTSKSSKSNKSTSGGWKSRRGWMSRPTPGFPRGLYPTIAISDSFNVAGHLIAAFLVKEVSPFASMGFFTVAIAGAFGVARFGFNEDLFADTNGALADYAAFVGLPCVGYELASLGRYVDNWLFASIFTLLEICTRPLGENVRNGVFKPLINIFLFVGPCILSKNVLAQIGIAVFVVGAVVIGPDREKYKAGVRCENWFHYAIGVAAVLIGRGAVEVLQK